MLTFFAVVIVRQEIMLQPEWHLFFVCKLAKVFLCLRMSMVNSFLFLGGITYPQFQVLTIPV